MRQGLIACITCELLALAVWIGGLLVLVAAVIPAVFNTFGGQDTGGFFLTRAFDGYNRLVLGSAAAAYLAERNLRGVPTLLVDVWYEHVHQLIDLLERSTQIGVPLILFWFGHGPVRGFAWTLSIGVVTSVITATLVTQFFIAIWFRLARPKKLPI